MSKITQGENNHAEEGVLQGVIEWREGAFELVYQRLHKGLYAKAVSLVGYAHADDVVQDTWVKVILSIAQYRGDGSFKAWIFTILHNTCMTLVRKEKKNISVGLDFEVVLYKNELAHMLKNKAGRAESPEAQIYFCELLACVEVAFSNLPVRQKKVLILRQLNALSLSEIANLLNVKPGNARVLLHRAKRALKTEVSQYFKEGTINLDALPASVDYL